MRVPSHQGRVRACGPVTELTSKGVGGHRYSLTLAPSSNNLEPLLSEIQGVLSVSAQTPQNGGPLNLDITVAQPEVQVPLILKRVIAANENVLACTPREQSLEDVLSTLVGEDP